MSKFYPLTVAAVRNETRDTIAVTFNVPPELKDSFQYQQGQHLTLRAQINDEDVRRSYSICSAVQDNAAARGDQARARRPVLDLGQRHAQAGRGDRSDAADGPLQRAAGRRATRATTSPSPPAAASRRSCRSSRPRLLTEPNSRFTLFYGNRASSTVIFKEELTDLKDMYMDRLQLAYVMSREQQDIELFNGRITKEKTEQLLRHWIRVEDIDVAFICGPEDMMLGVSAALQEAGMPKQDIKIELFAASIPKHQHKPRPHGADAPHETEVTVIMDGNHTSFTMDKDKESILDAGLRAGIDMRYSCKGGVCSTCRCKLVDGKVDMDVNYALEDYEIARGFVLSAARAFPVTDKVVVDFDQAE